MKFRTATYLPISEAYILHNIVFHIPNVVQCWKKNPSYFHTKVILKLTDKPVAMRPTLAACKDIFFLDLLSFKKNYCYIGPVSTSVL